MLSLPADNRRSRDNGFSILDETTKPLGLTASLALTAAQRRDVYALRHTSYLAGGFIEPRANAEFSDPYDQLPNCTSIIVYRGQRPVASVRVCVLDTSPHRAGWGDIPALHVFPDEIAETMAGLTPAHGGAGRAIEINRLVRHPDFVTDPALVFVLFHLAGYMILRHDADIVFSCVRKNHIPFYKRLKFTPVAGPRSYPELKFETNLLACSRENYDAVQRMMPLLENQAPEAHFSNLMAGKTVAVFARP